MSTYLGVSADLGPEDVDAEMIASAQITYLEGYLWDKPRAKQAFTTAAGIAHQADRRVALSLSDPFCVDRHRQDFQSLVDRHVDVLFANEDEIVSLYQEHSFDAALQRVRKHCPIAVLTRSERGRSSWRATRCTSSMPSPSPRRGHDRCRRRLRGRLPLGTDARAATRELRALPPSPPPR